jgi:radical SAM protein with 4Fe4S-binding SPASM domain
MTWMSVQNALARSPAVAFRGRLRFSFDAMPLAADGLSLSKRLNLMRCGVDALLPAGRAFGLPPAIQIEPTNVCNLRCPLCPTGSGSSRRKSGSMPLGTFRQIIRELEDTLVSVILYGWGEPFLNSDLTQMIRHCSERGILTATSTNGHFLQSVEQALRVVDAGLRAIVIAVDGSSQQTYEVYRKSGSVQKAQRCAAVVEEAKARRNSPLPYTNLRAVAMRANEQDLANLEQLAREMGVNMFSFKSLGGLSHAEALEDYMPLDPRLRRYEYRGQVRQRKASVQCPYPFRQPTVFWDGTIVGCEFDYDLEAPWGRFGEQPFHRIWNSRQAVRLRRAIRRRQGRPGFCGRCPYQDRAADSCVLHRVELRPAT